MDNKTMRILSDIFPGNVDTFKEIQAQKDISEYIKDYLGNDENNTLITSLFIKDVKKKHWKPKDHFTKIFNIEISYAVKKYGITKSELAFLYSLSPYLKWETNLIVDLEDNPINQNQLAELLDIHRRTVNRNMKSLQEKLVIVSYKLGKETFYLVNPYLMYCGKNINILIPKLFDMIGYEKCRVNRRETVAKRTKIKDSDC